MTLEGALYALLPIGLILSWTVSIVLLWGAVRRPFITALVERTALSVVISLTLTVYVGAVANAAIGYPIPKELAQVALRALFAALVGLQAWFLWLFLTRRFWDGGL